MLVRMMPYGHHLFTVNIGSEAWPILGMQFIQLIICQAGSLSEPGWKLCRRFKEDQTSASIPLITVTSDEGAAARINCLAAGADAHISGPLLPVLLEEEIEKQLASGATRRLPERSVTMNKSLPAEEKELLLQRLQACLSDVQVNSYLSVDKLARLMYMSRPTLYRKMKNVSIATPNELINEMRLKKAAELLTTGKYRIFEVARMMGYASQSSFGKSFYKYFNMTPSGYQRSKTITDAA